MDTHQQALLDELIRLIRSSRKANSDVRIDYSKWSEEARSSPIAFIDEFYSHLPYNCRACGKGCVFSAEEQKHVREVLKKRLEWGPAYCAECYAVRVGLERERNAFIVAWSAKRGEVRGSKEFLERWLEILETLPRFGIKRDSAKITQLRKLLQSIKEGE